MSIFLGIDQIIQCFQQYARIDADHNTISKEEHIFLEGGVNSVTE